MCSLRFVPLFTLFLVLSGMQTILKVDQTNAACCNLYRPAPGCSYGWWSMVSGSATKNTNGTFRITNNNGYSLDVTPSKEVTDTFDQFEKETVASKVDSKKVTKFYGVSILRRTKEGVSLTGFVPSRLIDHGKSERSLNGTMKNINDDFQKEAEEHGLRTTKITNASISGR